MPKLKALIFAFCLVCIFPSFSRAQNSDLGNWLIYFGNKELNEKWNIHHEIQYRNYNALGDLEQLLLRTGLGYSFENKNNLLLGYGFINSVNYITDTDSTVSINEHRIYQQFITKQLSKHYSLQHRYRFEQRFIESQTKYRFRYFLALNIALSKDGLKAKSPYLSFYNEVFLNVAETVFDRNRSYAGLGYKWNDNLSTELAYMNQFFSSSSRDQINMILSFKF